MIKVHLIKWSRWFREGREDIQDQQRPDQPVTETTAEHIEEIRCLIHLTIDEIQVETGMSCRIIEQIISDYLQLREITVRWVPNILTDAINRSNVSDFLKKIWQNFIKEHGNYVM